MDEELAKEMNTNFKREQELLFDLFQCLSRTSVNIKAHSLFL